MATYYNEKTYYGSYDGPSCTFRTVMQLRTVRNTSNCTVHVRRYVQTTGGSFKGTTIKTDWGESDTLYSNGTYADSGWVTLGTYSYGTTISVSGKSYYTGGSGTTYSSTASASYLPSKPTYTVSYDANTTDTVSNLPSNQTKTYGTALTISTAVPTREGYNFLNWNTSADGSGTSYASGASYTGNAALKLYAQWELAYHAPIVSGVTVGRCDADGNADDYGTYALVTFSWETDADYGATVASATVTLDGGSPVSATLTGTTEGTGSAKVGGSLDSETSYKVTVSVVDSAGGRGTASGVVPAVMFPIDFLKTGRGVAILMPSSDEGFHVGADAVFHGTLAVEGGLTGSAARPTYNGANLALASDVTGSTAAYLPITGGTLSGDVTMANEKYYKFATGAGVRGNTSGALVVSSEGDAGVFLRPNGSTSSTGVSVKTSAVHPEVANAVNLGHLTYKWANVYLSGSLSDGTNSVKVADISTSSHTHSLIYSPYKGSRQASADLAVTGDDSIKKFIATSTMTTNKPTLGDAHILHFEWDNTGGWSSQLALNNTTGQIEVRGMSSNTWNAWRQVLDSANFTNYVTPSSIGAVGYTTNAGIAVAGTTKPTYTYVPPSSDGSTGASAGAAYFPEGIIMGGTAAAAGLVTRGICGVSTPDAATGACTKENLFVNYDGTNDYSSGRQLVIQAGSVGTHYGNNLYQYAAARGDAVKAWVEAQGYLPLAGGLMTGTLKFQSSSLPSKSLQYICGIDAFANGGEMGWQSKSDFLSGYATTAQLANYSTTDHTHSDYASKSTANTYNGEQKFQNSSYCPTVTDTASGVGCAFKASRGMVNELLADKLIMTATTGKLPIYSYSGTSGGAMSNLAEVAYFDGGALVLTPPSGEGGQIQLEAAADDSVNNGICIDTAGGNFRVFGLQSRDGTSKPGFGNVFTIEPYAKYIGGGFYLDGTAAKANADGNGNNIASTYATKTELNAATGVDMSAYATITQLASYLPLSGGTMSGNIIVNNSNPHLGLQDSSGSVAYFQTYDDGSGLKAGFGYGWANSMKMDSSGAMYSPGSAYIGSGSGSVVEIGNSTDATTRIYGQQASITTGATNGLWINGRQYGANLTLWSGGYYMTASQSCTLSKSISNQPNGVVLIWSYYSSSASQNHNFITHFIPKAFVSLHGSCGMNFDGGNQTGNVRMNKYLYINDTSITGHASNGTDNAGDEFNVQNTYWVLRYVIGV